MASTDDPQVNWTAIAVVFVSALVLLFSTLRGGEDETRSEALPIGGDYYEVDGEAVRDYQPATPGVIEYCDLDHLERAVCAYGELTASQRAAELTQDRQDITVDPAGWPTNGQVTIPALEDVGGSADYNGWLWNRSHLIADSLGADAIRENLVTGTRTQNVGSTQVDGQYAGGMAFTEKIARDYLDSQEDDSCPMYYAATPHYEGDERLPRTVTVDIETCDAEVSMRVEVTNAANTFHINYHDGTSSEETS